MHARKQTDPMQRRSTISTSPANGQKGASRDGGSCVRAYFLISVFVTEPSPFLSAATNTLIDQAAAAAAPWLADDAGPALLVCSSCVVRGL